MLYFKSYLSWTIFSSEQFAVQIETRSQLQSEEHHVP